MPFTAAGLEISGLKSPSHGLKGKQPRHEVLHSLWDLHAGILGQDAPTGGLPLL